jgi:hypothetical protein
MDERLQATLDSVSGLDLATVAASVLGTAVASPVGTAQTELIVSTSGDPSTLGIVKHSGLAMVGHEKRPWSAVAKVIDLAAARRVHWVRCEDEVALYRMGAFGGAKRFRPAHCHLISEPAPDLVILWLEDMTGARRAPFLLNELARIVRDLGEWNALQLRLPPPAGLDLASYSVFSRWEKPEWDIAREFADFRAMEHGPEVRALYGDRPIDIAFDLRDAFLANNARSRGLTRTLCFGDANIGNLFATPSETVAVDWSSLTLDPLGVDAGSVIGSAVTFGGDFLAIATNERQLFERYVEGLVDGGWQGDRNDVRRAYFVHFGGYLISIAMAPAFIRKFDRARIERRAGMPIQQMFERSAPIIDLLPSYLEELSMLID